MKEKNFKLRIRYILFDKIYMTIILDDGSQLTFAQATGGESLKDSKGQTITFAQVGTTNTYTATVPLNDGSGRNQIFRFDKPDSNVIVSRKVQ
jgi:hypothetical protein